MSDDTLSPAPSFPPPAGSLDAVFALSDADRRAVLTVRSPSGVTSAGAGRRDEDVQNIGEWINDLQNRLGGRFAPPSAHVAAAERLLAAAGPGSSHTVIHSASQGLVDSGGDWVVAYQNVWPTTPREDVIDAVHQIDAWRRGRVLERAGELGLSLDPDTGSITAGVEHTVAGVPVMSPDVVRTRQELARTHDWVDRLDGVDPVQSGGVEQDRLRPDLTTVYSTSGCVQCRATVQTLDKEGVPYRVVNVTQDPAAAAFVSGLGYQRAPVVVTPNGEHWSGYRAEKITALAATPPDARRQVPGHQQVADRGHGSVLVAGRRRPAHWDTRDQPGVLWVSPEETRPYRAASPAERATFVAGDAYPGTSKQRWWNASLDAAAPAPQRQTGEASVVERATSLLSTLPEN